VNAETSNPDVVQLDPLSWASSSSLTRHHDSPMPGHTFGASGEDLVRVTIDFFKHLDSFGGSKGIALQGLVVC